MNLTLLLVIAIPVAVIGGSVLLAIVASRFASRARARRAENFTALAGRLGATVTNVMFPAMNGNVRGRGFRLETSSVRRLRFSHAKITMPAATPIRLELYAQTSKIAASMLSDIETGDRKFDDAAIVRSDRGGAVPAILDSGIRARLLELASREFQWRLVVHEREALLEWQGDFASAEMSQRAGAWVEVVALVAEACEREASS
ncbi:MAG: hypothetical protein WC538_16380 [Thermoanaerobaculia bacterium]|jgi:hypothetical protein